MNPTLQVIGVMSVTCSLLTASTIVCEDPTPPSGVTVVQPHTTTVSSVIVYQCQQPGFTPSPPSSVCGEDGRWSPDPSQVVCVMLPGTVLYKYHHSTKLYRNNHEFVAVCIVTNEQHEQQSQWQQMSDYFPV